MDANRAIRASVELAGDDRIAFGAGLLAAGYVLSRWMFRRPGVQRHWRTESVLVAALAIIGYVTYRLGPHA